MLNRAFQKATFAHSLQIFLVFQVKGVNRESPYQRFYWQTHISFALFAKLSARSFIQLSFHSNFLGQNQGIAHLTIKFCQVAVQLIFFQQTLVQLRAVLFDKCKADICPAAQIVMCYVVLLIFPRVLVHEIVLLQSRYRAAAKGSSSLFAHALA